MRLIAAQTALERGGRQLFRELSFEAGAGEALIVTGPNGAGKSSLLRALAGFLAFSAGAARVEGGDPEMSIGEQAHYLGHADGLKTALTAGENLAFWAGVLGGDPRRSAWLPALERLKLAHVADFPVRALSAGQKRRVALARLNVARRPIWLIDEPTTALDVAAQALFADVMRDHLAPGGLIVAATHAPLGLERTKTITLGRPVAEVADLGGVDEPPMSAATLRSSIPPRSAATPRSATSATGGGGLMTAMLALFAREGRIARRIGGGASTGAMFFLILVTLMPFALGPDLVLLGRLGPAILWIAALLSTLLGLDRLFQSDAEDGSLDGLVNASLPLELVVLVKCAAHWATSALPLVVASPLFGLMLGMDGPALGLTTLTLLAGTPALTMIGAIGAALTVSLRRGGLLLAVLSLPLTIPVLIFGVAAASAASGGASSFRAPFLMLSAFSVATVAGAPFAAAAALRHVRE